MVIPGYYLVCPGKNDKSDVFPRFGTDKLYRNLRKF